MKFIKKYWFRLIIIAISGAPLFMWACWLITPAKKLTIGILDKSSYGDMGSHKALSWILNHEKFSKNSADLYKGKRDYFGFFPGKKGNYAIKGLEDKTEDQLQQLSKDCDAVYIADVYGIYRQEWFQNKKDTLSGMLYGGLSREDLFFLKQMKQQKKLIIAEASTIETPTSPAVKGDFENTFGIKWTGWAGKYFDSFDTTKNKSIPKWIIDNYLLQYNNWPFSKPGLVLVHESGKIVILEQDAHLNEPVPKILPSSNYQQQYSLPKNVEYSNWFSIIMADTNINTVEAQYSIQVNNNGLKLLNQVGVSKNFPAIISHTVTGEYEFYYLCGDFCSNSAGYAVSYFKWIEVIRSRVTYSNKANNFFWKLYRPFIAGVLDKYCRRM